MKEKLISHITKATTKYRKPVILIFIVLCILSIISMILFMTVDTTFKGMAGQGTDVVDDFDKVMKKFEVSGTITVTAEPLDEKIKYVKNLRNEIDENVYNLFVSDELSQKDRDSIFSIIQKDYEGFIILNSEDRNNIAVEILLTLKDNRIKEVINKLKLTNTDKKELINKLKSNKESSRGDIYRKVQKLKDEDIYYINSLISEFNKSRKNTIIKTIPENLTNYDKQTLIQDLNSIDEDRKNQLLDNITNKTDEIDVVLNEFKEKALVFADEFKNLLLGNTSSGSDTNYDEIIKGVLYSSDFSISTDGLMYMIMVAPEKNVDEMFNSVEFATAIEKAIKELEPHYEDLVIKRTGFSVIAKDEEEAVMEGFFIMMGITIAGILIIFLVSLKRIIYPILSMIPLIMGILIMFGIFTLIVGILNLFSAMMPILLFGLGIDYAIHFGARYGEARVELGNDAEQEEVVRETFNSIGAGLLVSALTSALAFLALMTSSMIGLVQSGIIAGIGVLSAFLCMMYVLPILVMWRERKFKKKHKDISSVNFINSSKLVGMGKFTSSKIGSVIALLLFLFSISGIFIVPNIEIEKDAMKMEPEGLESVELAKELEDKYNASDTQTYFTVNGYDNLTEFRKELNRTKNGIRVYPTINIKRVMDAKRAIKAFESVGWERGNLDTLDKYKEKLSEKSSIISGSKEKIAELYEFMIRNYVDWDTNEYLVIVPPTGYIWDSEFLELHINDLNQLENNFGIEGVGLVKVWYFIVKHLINDLLLSVIVAFIIVMLILLIITRSIKGTFICFFNLLISFIITLVIIGLLGIKFNIVNIIAFPIVIGLGIDDSVHLYFRIVKEENLNIIESVSSTGKSIVLTTLTTLMAFGSFAFSIHPGLAELGLFTSIG
ncbi:MAG: MMPL family transporter, partial [Spirochaetota bacterium]